MTNARVYIYRNLRTGGFSVKYKGIVIDRLHYFTAENVQFKVSESARQRVIQDKRKNVHAYAASDKYVVEEAKVDKYLKDKWGMGLLG